MSAHKTRQELQRLFRRGAKPSEEDFRVFIESVLNAKDDGIERPAEHSQPLRITTSGPEEHVLDFYTGDHHTWRISQKPAGAHRGLLVSAIGRHSFFIERSTGRIGINTISPHAALHLNHADSASALIIDAPDSRSPLFEVNSCGNVGIKTSPSDEHALSVNGALRLQRGVAVEEFSNDGSFSENRDLAAPTEQAVKTYVDHHFSTLDRSIDRRAHPKEGQASLDFQARNVYISSSLGVKTKDVGNHALAVNGTLKLQHGAAVNEFSGDETLRGASELAVPTEKAVKTYVDQGLNTLKEHIESHTHPLKGSLSLDFSSKNIHVAGDVTVGRKSGQSSSFHLHGTLQLQRGAIIDEFSGDSTFQQQRDHVVPTEKAVKAFVERRGERLERFIQEHTHPLRGSSAVDFTAKNLKISENAFFQGTFRCAEGVAVSAISNDADLQAPRADAIPTELAVKSYVDRQITTLGTDADERYLQKASASGHFTTRFLHVNDRIGIGVAHAEASLHIQGDLRFEAGHVVSFAEDGQIMSRDKNHRILFRRPENIFEIREYGDILFSPGTRRGKETAKMIIKDDGQVGVGTTEPEQTLDVNGRLQVRSGVIQSGGDPITTISDLGLYSQQDKKWMRFVTTNAPILFYTDGDTGKNARLIINAEGNVGVGTVSPAKADLHLGAGNDMLRIGAVNFRGKAKNRSQYGLERSRNQILFSTYSGDQKDKIGAKIVAINKQTWHESRKRHHNQSTDLVFYTVPPNAVEHDATQERLRITDSGKIGIGTATPEAALHIDGNLRVGHWEIVDTGVLELRTEGGTRIRLGPDLFDNILAQQEKIEELTEKVKLLEKKLG